MLKENDDKVSLLFKDNSAAHGSGEVPRKMEDVLERGSGFNPGEVAVLLGQANGLGLALPDPSCFGVGGCWWSDAESPHALQSDKCFLLGVVESAPAQSRNPSSSAHGDWTGETARLPTRARGGGLSRALGGDGGTSSLLEGESVVVHGELHGLSILMEGVFSWLEGV